MTKNTHLATGVAIATAILMPRDIHSLAVCICGSAIGSTISDIDVASSKPRKELRTIVGISVAVITALIVLEFFLKIGIYSMIESQTSILKALLGFVLFLLLSVYGSTTKHRTYTHSVIGVISLTGAVWVFYPPLAFPFCLGIISHIALDILNTKKVRLLYPYTKFGVALKLCHAEGKANTTIGIISTLIFSAELIIFVLLHIKFKWAEQKKQGDL